VTLRSGRSGAPVVLVAEDHEDSREALRELLEAVGYEVHLARDGSEAVERARSVRPDLIVMDVMMPRVDGLEATRTLRASSEFGGVPIIALTAMEGGRERALEAGCDDFVPKPLDVGLFFRKVQRWLENGR